MSRFNVSRRLTGTASLRGVLLGLCGIAAVLASGVPALANPATYALTHSKVSGSIGGTSFTDAVLDLEYTLSDTSLLTNFSGGPPANGAFVRSPTFTGDELAFTITGGGLPSPVSGTFTSANEFQVGASTAVSTGALFFMTPDLLPYFGMQVPGTVVSPIPTLDRLTQSVSYTVDQPGNPGGTSSTQDPPGSGNYVGGVSVDNPLTAATTAGTLVLPQAQTQYNGSWTTTVAVPEPATLSLAILAAGGFLIARARRRGRR